MKGPDATRELQAAELQNKMLAPSDTRTLGACWRRATGASSCVILTLIVLALNCTLCLQAANQHQHQHHHHSNSNKQQQQTQQQQLSQALDEQHQQQLQQHVVAIQQAQQQQQAPAATPSSPKSAKSNHRLVNKIKDARHRRRHRHQMRRQQNQQQQLANGERHPAPAASQAVAFAAMAAAAGEPAAQAASSTALIALESIVEEVARAGAQLPLATASAIHQQHQQTQRQAQKDSAQQQTSARPAGPQLHSSPAVSGNDLLLEGVASTSGLQQAGQQQTSGLAVLPPSSQQQGSTPAAPVAPVAAPPALPAHATRGPLHNTRGFLLTTTLSKIYNLLNVTEFALEMRDGISSRASCVACNAVVGLFLSPLYSKEVFSAAIRTVCISFRIQSARVCAGLVESFQDDFEYIRKNTKLTRDEVCGVVFGVDCARRQTYNLFWTVAIPEMPPTHPNHPNNQRAVAQRPPQAAGGKTSGFSAPAGGPQQQTSSFLSLPLDEPSMMTSTDDAPDLFEYRKSNIAAAGSAQASATSGGALAQPAAENTARVVGHKPQDGAQDAHKQQQALAAASSPSLDAQQQQEQSAAAAQQKHREIQSPMQDQAPMIAAKKAAKMLKRPQYIFDDERQLLDANEQSSPAEQRSTFVHITDIHIDPYYEAGSLNECSEPLCCRATSGPVPAGDKRRQAGRWGDYGNCDVPVRTLRNALNRIREQHSNAEYWLWTGDISPHDIWNITKAEAANHVRLVTKMVRTYSNGLPVFPVIGNHEAHPVNSFSPPEIKGKFSMSWLYDLLADEWSEWLPEEALKTLRIGGYYKLQIRKGFVILALNTNYCARLNPWSFYDPVDPANQLKWLADELLEAELNQDKVHLIGHVPPDNRECTQAWLFNFINIVDRFRDTIEAQFYGHTHRDEWRVIYSLARPDEPIGVQYIGPSITPFTENNPAYRIYHQNKRGHIIDSETYYFNLTEANETPASEPRWRYSYSTRAHLNMTYGLGPDQWHKYLQKLHDDDEQFDNFYKNFYRYSDVKLAQVCKSKCKHQLLADLKLSHPYKTKPKPFLANRKTSNHHHRDRHDHHHRRLRSHQE